MIIIAHDVYEGCSDTDIYAIDTSKIKDAKLKQDLEKAKQNSWYEPYDDDVWDDEEQHFTQVRFPVTVTKILTIYYS